MLDVRGCWPRRGLYPRTVFYHQPRLRYAHAIVALFVSPAASVITSRSGAVLHGLNACNVFPSFDRLDNVAVPAFPEAAQCPCSTRRLPWPTAGSSARTRGVPFALRALASSCCPAMDWNWFNGRSNAACKRKPTHLASRLPRCRSLLDADHPRNGLALRTAWSKDPSGAADRLEFTVELKPGCSTSVRIPDIRLRSLRCAWNRSAGSALGVRDAIAEPNPPGLDRLRRMRSSMRRRKPISIIVPRRSQGEPPRMNSPTIVAKAGDVAGQPLHRHGRAESPLACAKEAPYRIERA